MTECVDSSVYFTQTVTHYISLWQKYGHSGGRLKQKYRHDKSDYSTKLRKLVILCSSPLCEVMLGGGH